MSYKSIPRITTSQRDLFVSAVAGDVIFNYDRDRIEVKTSSSWDAAASVPVGTILPWLGGYFTNGTNGGFTNVLANSIAAVNSLLLASGYRVCDGTSLNLTGSPIYTGLNRYLPNLTDARFLMGSTAGGTVGGANSITIASNNLPTHTHTLSGTATAVSNSDTVAVGASGHTHNSGTLFAAQWNSVLGGFPTVGAYGIGTTSWTPNHIVNNNPSYSGNPYLDPNAAGIAVFGNTGMPSADTTVAGTSNIPSHSHSLSGTALANTTTNDSIDNRPLYLSVFYIQRVI